MMFASQLKAWWSRSDRPGGAAPGGTPVLTSMVSDLERKIASPRPSSTSEECALLARTNELGAAYLLAGQFEDAQSVWGGILDRCARLFGPTHLNTLTVAGNIAVARAAIDPATAVAHLEAALAARHQLLGPTHAATLAARNAVAAAYRWQGRESDALALSRTTHQLAQAQLGPHHSTTFASWHGVAVAHFLLGDLARAEQLLQELLTDAIAEFGADDLQVQAVRLILADCHLSLGAPDAAQELLRPALAVYESVLGSHHPRSTATRDQLEVVAQSLARNQAASAHARIEHFQAAEHVRIDALRSLAGLDHPIETAAQVHPLAHSIQVESLG